MHVSAMSYHGESMLGILEIMSWFLSMTKPQKLHLEKEFEILSQSENDRSERNSAWTSKPPCCAGFMQGTNYFFS
jgi:hypothetical protein